MYPSRNDQKQKSHGFRGFSRISYTWRHKCATEIDNQSAAAGPDSIEYSPQRHGEPRGAMPIFMPGDQRFAFRHSRPGTAEKPCRKGMKSHAGAAFPPFPGVKSGRRRPRAGRDGSADSVSLWFVLHFFHVHFGLNNCQDLCRCAWIFFESVESVAFFDIGCAFAVIYMRAYN
jgi:hypothetical protein